MKTRFIQIIFFLPVLVFALQGTITHADFTSDPTTQSVQVTVSPENPVANSAVSFKVTSYLSDLDRASITWYVNGKRISSGTGLRNFTTTLGDVGSNTSVKVIVITAEGIT